MISRQHVEKIAPSTLGGSVRLGHQGADYHSRDDVAGRIPLRVKIRWRAVGKIMLAQLACTLEEWQCNWFADLIEEMELLKWTLQINVAHKQIW